MSLNSGEHVFWKQVAIIGVKNIGPVSNIFFNPTHWPDTLCHIPVHVIRSAPAISYTGLTPSNYGVRALSVMHLADWGRYGMLFAPSAIDTDRTLAWSRALYSKKYSTFDRLC